LKLETRNSKLSPPTLPIPIDKRYAFPINAQVKG
jgi:hypothetical protein